MTPNELLLWLSARKEGSWPQFRGAVATLDLASNADDTGEGTRLSLHQRIRLNLERLGHVEFDAAECEDGWRVVPPALALSQDQGKTIAVLCGARTPKLVENLERSAGNGLQIERAPHPDCPDIIRILASDEQTLIELAQRIGIRCQPDASTALLAQLPPVDSLKGWKAAQLPVMGNQWEVKQFFIERKLMTWRSITLQQANAPGAQGLFCFTRFQIPHYFLREGRNTIKLPGALGKYYMLHRRQRRVLTYDPKQHCLSMPAIFRPPLLTERALILCSGFPPSISAVRGRPRLAYRDIPEEIAGQAAEVLRQDSL